VLLNNIILVAVQFTALFKCQLNTSQILFWII